jgi:hypothetical protein
VLIAAVMDTFGPPAYFGSLCALTGSLGLYAMWRKGRRAAVPAGQKVRFVGAQPQAVSGEMLAGIGQNGALARDDTH